MVIYHGTIRKTSPEKQIQAECFGILLVGNCGWFWRFMKLIISLIFHQSPNDASGSGNLRVVNNHPFLAVYTNSYTNSYTNYTPETLT